MDEEAVAIIRAHDATLQLLYNSILPSIFHGTLYAVLISPDFPFTLRADDHISFKIVMHAA